MWSSQYSRTHGARRNEILMPEGQRHAFRLWREAGYHTGLIGKNHCFNHDRDLDCFDTWCEISHVGVPPGAPSKGMPWFRPMEAIRAAHETRRQQTFRNPKFACAVTDHPLDDYSSGLITGQTERFLEHHGHAPFALWVSFPDPHEPWDVPRTYYEQIEAETVEMTPQREDEFSDDRWPERNRVLHEMIGLRDVPREDVLDLIRIYHAMVRFVDDSVGRILRKLDELALRENTIVVFCADHGDFMGEHGMQCKGGLFYDSLTHVPLIVSCPGRVPEGLRDESMVSLMDVVPTVLQLQDIDVPDEMQGVGLPPIVSAPRQDAVFAEYGAGGAPFRGTDLAQLSQPHGRKALIRSLQWREAAGERAMIRTQDWKYIHDPMGDTDELYHLANDPWELDNVVDEPANSGTVDTLRRRLQHWRETTPEKLPVPMPAPEKYGAV
ncbi:MAG: sulfatase-like hydrolase/transferase [Lentisphaerae bacterium]|nr:sulfatase-like hydrolase/transferase [Lentisphaerota bacterium]